MKSVSYQGNELSVDDEILPMPYAIRDAFLLGEKIIVLLDPNAYLNDPSYGKDQRRGDNPLKNLFALSRDGKMLWEAEFPERVDYYYRVTSKSPLTALSYSSFRCEINSETGRIIRQEFLK